MSGSRKAVNRVGKTLTTMIMKELSLEKMEMIEGGSWGCFFAIGGYVAVIGAAILAPPAGIALAGAIIGGAFTFAGSTYAISAGACG